MATRTRRPRRWYERTGTPRDPRLWLYGPVPPGFWQAPDNQRLYMDWLGEQLGYTQPDDWYQLSTRDIKTRRGASVLKEFGSSPIAIVKAHFPQYDWHEWRFRMVPKGFWANPANRHRYLAWLGTQLGFTTPEDWYRLAGHHLHQHYGGTLLNAYGGSPSALVKEYFPDRDWKEWLFDPAPQRFWQQPANRRRYLDWLGEQLGFQREEDWYQMTYADFTQWHGTGLLEVCGHSPFRILQEYRPTYDWLEWRLVSVPNGFWDQRRNRTRYLDWLGKQLGFVQPEDWYQLSERDLQQHHGSRLLAKFRSSPSAIVKDYLPRRRWLEWRFGHAPTHFWEEPANCRRYLQWLGKTLGFRRPEDWYRLSGRQVLEHYGAGLLKYYESSPAAIVKAYWPQHQWLEWRFASTPKGWWDKPANRRCYLDWLGKALGFTSPEDWYQFTGRELGQREGGTLLTKFGGSPLAMLKEYVPDYDWQEWRLVSTPQRFWQSPANQRRYVVWLGKQLGFRSPEDWYTLSTRQVKKHYGGGLLAVIGNSRMAVLHVYRPDYEWKEWLLRQPPTRFWHQAQNRTRYFDWLGQQLGYQHAEDWARLRVVDVRQHKGEGLLTYCASRLAPLVDEYLQHR